MTRMFLILFALAGSLFAQQPVVEGREYPLAPIPDNIQKRMTSDGKGVVCGQYFYMATKDKRPNADGKYTITNFNFMNGDTLAFMMMGVDKFVVIVDSTKTIPTAMYAVKWGFTNDVPFHWIIRISKKDLVGAQACIPEPTPEKK